MSGDPVLAGTSSRTWVDNAARYTIAGGDICISTRRVGGSCRLNVTNSGLPIGACDAARHVSFPRLVFLRRQSE